MKFLKCAIIFYYYMYYRLNIDSKGNLFYNHIKDATWDLNEYVLELKNTLKHWRDVYWRLWGIINYLNCSRCGEIFPCAELGIF